METAMTFCIVICMFLLLIWNRFETYQVFLGGVGLLWMIGVITPSEIVTSYFNQTTFMIGALFAVISVVQHSSFFIRLMNYLLGGIKTYRMALLKMMMTVSGLSAFFNNTPLVMMTAPIVEKWAYKHGIRSSKLLIPLSYAATLGGMCTLIGTSTNLIVSSLMEQAGYSAFTMFELSAVGIPVALIGILYVVLTGNYLLPNLNHVSKEKERSNQSSVNTNIKKQRILFLLFLIMIAVVSFQIVTMFQASLILMIIYILTGALPLRQIIHSVNWKLLCIVGSSFVLSTALTKTGSSLALAEWLSQLNGLNNYLLLFIIYGMTNIITEIITNNAAAVFTFPIALALSCELSISMEPFAIAIAIAASASFSTPIGYQTNLIVLEKGGYHFIHFLKAGFGLNCLVMLFTVFIIPIFWKF